ncbi:MAG TPA: hypothetical protein VNN10_02570 [Dehalococcoidia bacterium]|nr:hypothetical protein [Dehalococcoidia bacterium]
MTDCLVRGNQVLEYLVTRGTRDPEALDLELAPGYQVFLLALRVT